MPCWLCMHAAAPKANIIKECSQLALAAVNAAQSHTLHSSSSELSETSSLLLFLDLRPPPRNDAVTIPGACTATGAAGCGPA